MGSNDSPDNITVGDIEHSQGVAIGAGATAIVGYTAEQVSALLGQIGTTFQAKPFDGRSPYVGLAAFQEVDADRFFGREKLISELVSRVDASRPHAIFIAGPSGSGKSSLARAGLMHALKAGALPKSETWLYETMQPGRAPLDELGRVVSRWANSVKAGDEFRTSANDPSIFHRWAEVALGDARDRRAVLLIDQFEEVFTQVSREREAERAAFLNLLTHAATVENGRVTILFALRSDFVSHCASYPQLNALLNQQFLQVGAMTPDELVSAIARPALRVGLRIDPDLIAQIVNEMRDAPNALPLMQFALDDLFEHQRAQGGVVALTLPDYLVRGGLHKALERHADAAFAQLDASEQNLARAIFAGVIEIGRGSVDTRRTALFDELVPAGANIAQAEAVVQKLADARLIATDEQGGKETVTLAHERLIDAWQWLRRLVSENRGAIALQNEIAQDAREWGANRHDASYLYIGARLAIVREQLDTKKIVLSGLAQAFVEAGIQAQEAERRMRQRRVQLTFAGLMTAFLLISALAILALQQGSAARTEANARATAEAQAISQRDLAQEQQKISRSREMAAIANSNLNIYPELSLLLALQANLQSHTFESEDALRQALLVSHLKMIMRGHAGAVYSVAYSPDGKYILTGSLDETARLWDVASGREVRQFSGHTDGITSVAFSPNGKQIVTGGQDKTARIWDVNSGREVTQLRGHTDWVNSVAFSPDGKQIVTGSQDKTVRLWDAASGRQVMQLLGHTEGVNTVAFSPDGKQIASGSGTLIGSTDSTVRLWDVASGRQVKQLPGITDIRSVAYSPDGTQIVAANRAGTAQIWDLASGRELAQLRGHTDWLNGVAYSPDGKLIATASDDKTARIWDAATGREVAQLRGHTEQVHSVAFSPDGKQIVTGNEDATVRLWDVASEREAMELRGHTYAVNSVAFSPDGKHIVTAGQDKTVRLWDVASRHEAMQLRGHTESVQSVAFSPDGKEIVTGSEDKTVRLWDVASGRQVMQLPGNSDMVSSVAFSPDGKQIAAASGDGTVRVWDAASGRVRTELTDTINPLTSVAFSPDGKQIAVGNWDNTAHVWDLASRRQLAEMRGHTDFVESVAFSPDGKQIATASRDNTVRLWDAASGREMMQLHGHTDWVIDVAFSPDGRQIVTGGGDSTTRIWDVASGREMALLHGQTEPVRGVAFSPDGKQIVAGSGDGTALVYLTHIEDLIALAKTRVTWELTCEERVEYLHEEKACPTEELNRADNLAVAGDRQKALESFTQLVELAVQENDAALNNSICWRGSIDGFAQIVLPLCERAVASIPNHAPYIDSRGLARVLVGDRAGGIADFKTYVELIKSNPDKYSGYGHEREKWIAILEAGGNPFDAATLDALRSE